MGNFTKVGKLIFRIRRGEKFGVWQRWSRCQTPILLLFWNLLPAKMKYTPAGMGIVFHESVYIPHLFVKDKDLAGDIFRVISPQFLL